MRSSLLFLAVLLAANSSFGNESSEFGDIRKIDKGKFVSSFRLKAEVYVLDPSGKRFIAQIPEERSWSAGPRSKKIESNWTFKAHEIDPVILHHVWELHDDNSVSGVIQQFEPGANQGKLAREQKYTLESFSPISWIAQTTKDYQVVVRFTPEMGSYQEATDLEKVQIGGDRGTFMVTDNQGYLWAEDVRFGGVFAGLKSHRGGFVISFYPFKGASEIGVAQGKTIELKMTDKLRVTIKNETEIVPGDLKAKVYGIYLPNFKMSTNRSHWSFGQGKYEGIPEEFLEAKK